MLAAEERRAALALVEDAASFPHPTFAEGTRDALRPSSTHSPSTPNATPTRLPQSPSSRLCTQSFQSPHGLPRGGPTIGGGPTDGGARLDFENGGGVGGSDLVGGDTGVVSGVEGSNVLDAQLALVLGVLDADASGGLDSDVVLLPDEGDGKRGSSGFAVVDESFSFLQRLVLQTPIHSDVRRRGPGHPEEEPGTQSWLTGLTTRGSGCGSGFGKWADQWGGERGDESEIERTTRAW